MLDAHVKTIIQTDITVKQLDDIHSAVVSFIAERLSSSQSFKCIRSPAKSILCREVYPYRRGVCTYIVSVALFYTCSKVHVSQATLNSLRGAYNVEPAYGKMTNDVLAKYNVETFFITSRRVPATNVCINIEVWHSKILPVYIY